MSDYFLNPKTTHAILIGVSDYVDFESIQPAQNNVNQLAWMLEQEGILGIPSEHIHSIINKDSTEILEGLLEFTENVASQGVETLILYYVGHGYRRRDGQYYLAATDTRKKLVNHNGNTALDYASIKKAILDSQIPQSIIILDACYSGLATQGEKGLSVLEFKGSYTLTSSDSHEVSYFDTDGTHTLFTGELLRLMEMGVPKQEEMITLNQLYNTLKETVSQRNPKMSPQQMASKEITASSFYFCKNAQFDRKAISHRKVQTLISKGDQLLELFSFGEAKLAFYEARELTKEFPDDNSLSEQINDKLDECEEKRELYIVIKTQLGAKYQEELKKANNELMARKEVSEAISQKYTNELNDLRQELEDKLKELKDREIRINSLEKLLNQQEAELVQLKQVIVKMKFSSQKKGKNFLESLQEEHFKMIHVKGGNFKMGSPIGEKAAFKNELQHEVTVTDYFIGEFPVTRALWRAVMGSDPPYLGFNSCDDCPVAGVNWKEITDSFLPKLNQLTGKSYRLLTEAEWEFAARGGIMSKGFKYAGSNQLDELGWYDTNSESKAHSVGGKKPNELGIYDMSGNVFEWCQDWYGSYGKTKQEDPNGPKTGSSRVVRGGSWRSSSRRCRVAYRGYWRPGDHAGGVGFRLAHNL